MIVSLFNAIFYHPILNALVFLYEIVGRDLGVAIILLTIVLRVIIFPLTRKSTIAQKELQRVQPEIKRIQQEYKSDPQKQAAMIMQTYRDHKISPFAGMWPLFIQLPILIALLQALRIGTSTNGAQAEIISGLYSWIPDPGAVNTLAFGGIVNLTKPMIELAIIAGLAQFMYAKMLQHFQAHTPGQLAQPPAKDTPGSAPDMMSAMQKQMMYFMPVMMFFITLTLPSGLGLYWAASTLMSIGELHIVKNRHRTHHPHTPPSIVKQ